MKTQKPKSKTGMSETEARAFIREHYHDKGCFYCTVVTGYGTRKVAAFAVFEGVAMSPEAKKRSARESRQARSAAENRPLKLQLMENMPYIEAMALFGRRVESFVGRREGCPV